MNTTSTSRMAPAAAPAPIPARAPVLNMPSVDGEGASVDDDVALVMSVRKDSLAIAIATVADAALVFGGPMTESAFGGTSC